MIRPRKCVIRRSNMGTIYSKFPVCLSRDCVHQHDLELHVRSQQRHHRLNQRCHLLGGGRVKRDDFHHDEFQSFLGHLKLSNPGDLSDPQLIRMDNPVAGKHEVIDHTSLDRSNRRKRLSASTGLASLCDDIAKLVSDQRHRKRMQVGSNKLSSFSFTRRGPIPQHFDN